MELEELLPILDEGKLPGIFRKVTERFMDMEVRPEQIQNDLDLLIDKTMVQTFCLDSGHQFANLK